jgi:polyferredoxin
MIASLSLAGLALRSGLALRRSRMGRARRTPELRPRHLRLAKPAVVLALLGFAGGPVSSVWLRGWDAFSSFHGVLGVLVTGLFAGAAVIGRRIERHGARSFDVHALMGALAFLLGALAAVAGFVLLP